jgi:hypothetical protein
MNGCRSSIRSQDLGPLVYLYFLTNSTVTGRLLTVDDLERASLQSDCPTILPAETDIDIDIETRDPGKDSI